MGGRQHPSLAGHPCGLAGLPLPQGPGLAPPLPHPSLPAPHPHPGACCPPCLPWVPNLWALRHPGQSGLPAKAGPGCPHCGLSCCPTPMLKAGRRVGPLTTHSLGPPWAQGHESRGSSSAQAMYSLVRGPGVARQSSLPELRGQKAQCQHVGPWRGPVAWGAVRGRLRWKAGSEPGPTGGRRGESQSYCLVLGYSSVPKGVPRNCRLRTRLCVPWATPGCGQHSSAAAPRLGDGLTGAGPESGHPPWTLRHAELRVTESA